jgi:hypothetical protein
MAVRKVMNDHPFPDEQIRHLAMWIKVTPYGNISPKNAKILLIK